MTKQLTTTNHLPAEDLFIFERMAEGDQRALRYFFDKYYDALCNYVNLYIRNRTISEDIVQELFIHFWEKREMIAIDSSVKAYLFRASRNKYLNYIRDEKSHQLIEQKVQKTQVRVELPDERQLDAGQLNHLIEKVILTLPPRCREVYQLHREGELSYKEIAARMQISEKTVENQMTIALRRLKSSLAPYYDQIFALCLIGLFA